MSKFIQKTCKGFDHKIRNGYCGLIPKLLNTVLSSKTHKNTKNLCKNPDSKFSVTSFTDAA